MKYSEEAILKIKQILLSAELRMNGMKAENERYSTTGIRLPYGEKEFRNIEDQMKQEIREIQIN